MLTTTEPHPFAARRANVRRQIAELRIQAERHKEIQAAIRRVDAEVDQAEESHEQACRPIQDELAVIRGEQVDVTIAGNDLPAERELRRQELMAIIDVENEKLREAVRRADDKRAALQHELIVVGAKMKTVGGDNEQTLTNKLAGELARPEQVCQLYAAKSAGHWATARREAAAKNVEATTALVARGKRGEFSDLDSLEKRLLRHQAELDAAYEAERLAVEHQKQLREQIIAE
ncbi:coiled-coil domain-containing protein [Lacipirellula limnantheis]|uniref:Chromosome partition protein Smc n=1 Tax=Lacipirellula limnantheis TaxID=2528024 RepID=A0A517U1D7_9BACT|nr:hypothetical protein [Lacipirellula limnantheis]QDT74429.1 hypothetical protein I41_36250 [Lacipirellula limnantheis]